MPPSHESLFVDSSIVFYCAGCIGYRWAVKVTTLIARDDSLVCTDTLFFEELLDRFDLTEDRDRGEILFQTARRLVTRVLPVTANDFDTSCTLALKYPDASPRLLLRVAVMLNNGIDRIVATHSSRLQSISEVTRVNLLEQAGSEQAVN